MTKIAIVYFSNFKGNTETLAKAVQRGAEAVPGTEVTLIHTDAVDEHWLTLHAADAIIFGSPTYIGSVAAKFKEFIEKLAGEVWLQRLWVNKIAGGFTVSAGRGGDKLACLQQLAIFAAQMGMIWVPMRITGGNYSTQGSEADLNRMAGYLGVMAQANIDEPPELAPPPSDIQTAELHGNHIAHVARQFAHGRKALAADYDTYADQAPGSASAPLSLPELLEQP
ncbi:flavodoxin family protein [Halieaceae bacterium IMCC14734]|uniref:Flavodoxin family protein n=1 Tax=Candidatus Litorirhabdus singularis TaxID=2518993 RepID=A0ABT3TFQ8_9GAMM|nr:flavodoxin family protein [Candidatus Litorirhabdus singularis]MCX2980611.1 flavodoxin family protein [Candidatus Litorirhabdus singularis]